MPMMLQGHMVGFAAAAGISKPTSCYHGGIYSVNPKLVKLDFSSNVNPLGISKTVLASVSRHLSSISSSYPDPECVQLKKNIVDYLDSELSLDSICVGNGATELIHDFAKSFVRKKALIPAPTFCEYEVASNRIGAHVTLVPLKNMRFDPETLIEKSKKQDAVFLCNPNNPTGLVGTREIKKVIERLDNSTKVLIDESFIELVDEDNKAYSFIDKVNEFDNLVVLRSFTKSFALAGLRIGYCVSNPKLAKKIAAKHISWNVNGVAQMAAIVALKDVKRIAKARELVQKERTFMYKYINGNLENIAACSSDANYFLIHLKSGDSKKIRDVMLARRGILVRDCSTFNGMGSRYIRVAVKIHDQNLLLLNALQSLGSWI
jgi:threonine-phosphate decarboxylase